MATSKIRVLGKPKPPQTGQLSPKVVKEPVGATKHAYQHQFGELACLMKFTRDPQLKMTLLNASPVEAERIAGEWFDAQVAKYRAEWRELTGEAPWEQELAKT